jgi:CheY-like chemotaxis protein
MQVQDTILIVDDDAEIREALAALLADAGYAIVCCADGAEALARLERGPLPGGILLDLMMPRMTGWELAAALGDRPQLAGIPVVVMSAAPEEDFPSGATAILRKPFSVEDLFASVRAALDARRALRAAPAAVRRARGARVARGGRGAQARAALGGRAGRAVPRVRLRTGGA